MIQSACHTEAKRQTGFYVVLQNTTAFRGELPGLITDRLGNLTVIFFWIAQWVWHNAITKLFCCAASSKWFTIIFSVIFFLTRATRHMRASLPMIHRELFLSNSITVSAVTPDMYTAHNLPAAPEKVSYSQGGSTGHRHTITETYSRWQELHDSASPLRWLHSRLTTLWADR